MTFKEFLWCHLFRTSVREFTIIKKRVWKFSFFSVKSIDLYLSLVMIGLSSSITYCVFDSLYCVAFWVGTDYVYWGITSAQTMITVVDLLELKYNIYSRWSWQWNLLLLLSDGRYLIWVTRQVHWDKPEELLRSSMLFVFYQIFNLNCSIRIS